MKRDEMKPDDSPKHVNSFANNIVNNIKNLNNIDLSKENIKTIGTLFKKRFTTIGKTVVTNRIWLKSSKSSICHVLITLTSNITYQSAHFILDKILKSGLIVNVKYHTTTRTIAFYITATYERLLQGAEDLELKKPIKLNFGGGIKEFIFEEQEFYENIENEDLFLTTQEKQSIIFEILNQITCDPDLERIFLEGKKLPNGRKLIHWCLTHKIITQIMPIHDQEDLKELRFKWVFAIAKHQPLDKICKYFGIKLALYFAWLGFYTKALVIPAFLGLAMWLSIGADEYLNSIFFLVICGFNLVWSICFNELWKQKCAEYSYKWGTLDIKQDLLQDPRPMYKGEYKPSKVTNKLEPHYPDYKRALFRYFVTLPCLCVTIVTTVVLMILMFQLQEFFDYATKINLFPALLGFTCFMPKMIYANLISALNSFYKRLCTWLNDKENYREQLTHENHLIIKIVLFQFINSYLSLFYIAFYLRDVELLQQQLFAIFITRQFTGNFKESILPYILANMKQIKIIDKTKKQDLAEPNHEIRDLIGRLQNFADKYLQATGVTNEKRESNPTQPNDYEIDSNLSQPEVETLMPNYPDTFGDYLEMIMQFGLMVFFSPAFPLAPLFSLVNNIIEIRSDAFKMCLLFQRPFGQRVANIGKWQNVLEVFSTLGIIVNCGLLVTFGVIQKLIPSISFYESIIIIIVIEHVFLGFNKFLSYSIPDLPKWIIIEKCKLEHRRIEALKQIELNEIHNLKNLAD